MPRSATVDWWMINILDRKKVYIYRCTLSVLPCRAMVQTKRQILQGIFPMVASRTSKCRTIKCRSIGSQRPGSRGLHFVKQKPASWFFSNLIFIASVADVYITYVNKHAGEHREEKAELEQGPEGTSWCLILTGWRRNN